MPIRPGVVGPVHGVGRTLRSGELRASRSRADQHLVLLPDDLVHRERDGRVRNIHNEVDPVLVEPLARDYGSHVGLVLMIGENHVDPASGGLGAVVLDRHLRGEHRAASLKVRVYAGLIVEHGDADRLVLRGDGAGQGQRRKNGCLDPCHGWTPYWVATMISRAGRSACRSSTKTARRSSTARWLM